MPEPAETEKAEPENTVPAELPAEDPPEETPEEPASESEEDVQAAEETEAIFAIDFSVLDVSGQKVSLSDRLAEGKPIVLNFWATWCGPCKSELPSFDKAAAEYADRITFMLLSMPDGYRETVDGVKSFMETNGYTFPVYFDTEYSAAIPYGASSIPLTYFILSSGEIVGGYPGAMSEEILYYCLEKLLELEKSVEVQP